MILIKSEEQICYIKQASKVVADTLSLLSSFIVPGKTGLEIDALAEEFIRSQGAIPSCKGYQGYPNSICLSIDSEAVHCLPTNKPILEGQVVKIDLTASVNGWNADAARTILIPPITKEMLDLHQIGLLALQLGISQAKEGNYVNDISQAVFDALIGTDYSMVKQFCGHFIGRSIHERPQIPNTPQLNKGPMLVSGMVACIEPIVVGSKDPSIHYKEGEWPTWALSKANVVHNEETVLITPQGPEILTR